MSKHTKETLSFSGFSGYYGSVPAGYGGFDWVDVNYMNATYWEKVETNWCDTGYQNVILGTGEAYSYDLPNNQSPPAQIVTPDLYETFSLTSMRAASAWETKQPFTFNSYTWSDGQFTLKASDTVKLSQTPQTIDFAKIGKPTDFQDIARVSIVAGYGKYGNTCTYGAYGFTTGSELAFDNLKVVWNGKIPHGHLNNTAMKQLLLGHHHSPAYAAAHLVTGGGHDESSAGGHPTSGHADNGYHTQLLSLPGDGHESGLTSQFALPQVTHFGT